MMFLNFEKKFNGEKFTDLILQIMRSFLLQLFAIYSIHALENPIPASYLQPRNFNPHPYQREGKAFLIVPTDDYQSVGPEKNYEELSRRFEKYVEYCKRVLRNWKQFFFAVLGRLDFRKRLTIFKHNSSS